MRLGKISSERATDRNAITTGAIRYHIECNSLIMNRYVLFLMATLLSFGLFGCGDDDDEDMTPIVLDLLGGTWEVVSQGDQDIFHWEEILDISSSQIHEGYGGYQGSIDTYFLTSDGSQRHDRTFTWTCLEMENYQPILDVVHQGDLDGDDASAGNYHYKIIKLTPTHMWWETTSTGRDNIIKFKRRDDIRTE